MRSSSGFDTITHLNGDETDPRDAVLQYGTTLVEGV
jgi:hypothetical protein